MYALVPVCDPLHIVTLDAGSDSQRVTSKSVPGASILSADRGGEGIAGAKPGRGGTPRSPPGTRSQQGCPVHGGLRAVVLLGVLEEEDTRRLLS